MKYYAAKGIELHNKLAPLPHDDDYHFIPCTVVQVLGNGRKQIKFRNPTSLQWASKTVDAHLVLDLDVKAMVKPPIKVWKPIPPEAYDSTNPKYRFDDEFPKYEKGFEGFLPAIKNSGQVFDPTTPFTMEDFEEFMKMEIDKPLKPFRFEVPMTEGIASALTCEQIKAMAAMDSLVVIGGTKGMTAFYKRMEECGVKTNNNDKPVV